LKDKDRFDVEAATSANPSQAQMLAMMRTMLADRFKLRAHTETRALPSDCARRRAPRPPRCS
jgi:uncharacterized protein (TIGR03435 family)